MRGGGEVIGGIQRYWQTVIGAAASRLEAANNTTQHNHGVIVEPV